MKKSCKVFFFVLASMMLVGCTISDDSYNYDIQRIEEGRQPTRDVIKLGEVYFNADISHIVIYIGLAFGVFALLSTIYLPRKANNELDKLEYFKQVLGENDSQVEEYAKSVYLNGTWRQIHSPGFSISVWVLFMIGCINLCMAYSWLILLFAASILVFTLYKRNYYYNIGAIILYLIVLVAILLFINSGHLYTSYQP